MMRRPETEEEAMKRDAERFWPKVDKTKRPDGCWIWTGVINKKTGRGHYNPTRFQGVPVREGRATVQAHVWAYILTFGSRPLGHGLQRGSAGIILRHSCGNGHIGCVNPHHLRIGTQADNAKETRLHGRAPDQQLKAAMNELQQRRKQTAQLQAERDRMKVELARLKRRINDAITQNPRPVG